MKNTILNFIKIATRDDHIHIDCQVHCFYFSFYLGSIMHHDGEIDENKEDVVHKIKAKGLLLKSYKIAKDWQRFIYWSVGQLRSKSK